MSHRTRSRHFSMQQIHLIDTLPQVFADRTDLKSDVWHHDITLERGQTYLIEAGSGTGKSSLCSFVYGYRNDYQGTILFDSADTRTFSVSQWTEIRRRHLSLLWQELRLFPELTALENVQLKNRLTGFQKSSQIDQWFELLGIADRRDTLVARMSFGQQQRVAMIRALCQPFDFIFIDEPISHLDDHNADIMGQLLVTEAQRQGAAIVTTSIGKHLNLNYTQIFKL